MNLKLIRKYPKSDCVIGELYLNGAFECYTLEDPERTVKIKNVTAIPKGTYEIRITHSNHFKRDLPLLLNVPNYEGVRIHSGNTAADTEGCILVGKGKAANSISQSRDAFNALFPKLQAALQLGKVTIEITGGTEAIV